MVEALPRVEAAERLRLGSLEGQVDVPDDFDETGREEIECPFYGDPDG